MNGLESQRFNLRPKSWTEQVRAVSVMNLNIEITAKPQSVAGSFEETNERTFVVRGIVATSQSTLTSSFDLLID